MPFTTVCRKEELAEGQQRLFRVGKRTVLMVWPAGREVRAYRGRCPHADVPLETASLEGCDVVCNIHGWRFDAGTGRCNVPGRAELKPYPLREEAGSWLVDLPLAPRSV